MSEIKEIRTHHEETQQKVLKMERELNEVHLRGVSCILKELTSLLEQLLEERSQLPAEDTVKKRKVEIEYEQRAREGEVQAANTRTDVVTDVIMCE